MRIFRPGSAPIWLEQVLLSIERGLNDIWSAPLRLWRSDTAGLPDATSETDYTGALAWDKTALILTWFNGTSWVRPEPTIAAGTTAQYWRGDKSWQTLDKAAVGLSNVDNTSNATERAATATLTNKTMAFGSNTITGTKAQFDTALTDSNFMFAEVPTWTAPTLNTGWVSHSAIDSTWQAVEYTKTADGHVYLRGLINPATATSKTMFTLPTGYRPAKRASFLQGNSAAGAAGYWIYVQDDGQVQLDTPALSSSQYIPLDVVQFWTA